MAAETSVAETPHLVLLVRHALYLRNYESLVRRLSADGWRITIATLAASRAVDQALARALVVECRGVQQVELPRIHGLAQEGLEAVFTGLDWLRFFDANYHDSPALEERAKRRVMRPLRTVMSWYGVEGNTRRRLSAQAHLQRIASADVASRLAMNKLAELKPTVLAVTPLVDIDGGQHAYVQAAAALGIPCAHLVASWDNLTIKGLIHRVPDRVVVWNRWQAAEAMRHHGVPPERLVSTGAQLFDWLTDDEPVADRETFLSDLGLDPDRRTVLYVGSSSIVGEQESRFLLDQYLPALRSYWDPNVANANVIVRPHPTNALEGQRVNAKLRKFDVRLDPRAGEPVVDDATRAHYRALLTHADVVVGVNTSAFLEAAVCGTAVIPVTSRRVTTSQQSAPHFRMLVSAGLFGEPPSLYGHLELMSSVMTDPASTAPQLAEFVNAFVNPPNPDQTATDAITSALDSLAASGAVAPSRRRRTLASLDALIAVVLLGFVRRADRLAVSVAKRAIGLSRRLRTREFRTSTKAAAPVERQNASPAAAPSPAEPAVRLGREEREEARRARYRRKTVVALKVETYRVLHGPNRYLATRRLLRRIRKIVVSWIRRIPGIARPSETATARTPIAGLTQWLYDHVTRPLLAARGRRASTARRAELISSLVAANKSGRAIVFGPWTSEVGFELLYWVPFVRRLVQDLSLAPERITIISRGGTSGWYDLPRTNYLDILDVLTPREFHDQAGDATKGKKQTRWTPVELDLVRRLAPADAFIVHPLEMYLTLTPYFVGRTSIEWVDNQLAPPTAPSVTDSDSELAWQEVKAKLPERYLAVGLYTRPSFTKDLRDARLRTLLDNLQRSGLPLVSLETGLVLDDHRSVDLSRIWISRPLLGVAPRVNLALQTRLIAASSGLVCTYGGVSYLGAALDVPTVALFDDDQRILWHHLDLAKRRFVNGRSVYQVANVLSDDPAIIAGSLSRTEMQSMPKHEIEGEVA